MNYPLVAPSVLSIDFSHLDEQLDVLKEAGIKVLHFDVMDGHFVTDISFGEHLLKFFQNKGFDLDIHLMVTNPLHHLLKFLELDSSASITIHYEAIKNNIEEFLNETKQIRENHRIGIAINPDTDIEEVGQYFKYFKKVMLMSVFPGASGKSYVEGSHLKIKRIKELVSSIDPTILIEIDGGINGTTGPLAILNGADILVSGSYLFKATDKKEAINSILGLNNPKKGE